MELLTNHQYTHTDHGNILLLTIHQHYESYTPETGDGEPTGMYVQFTTEWDEYGPLPTTTQTEPLEQFAAQLTDHHDRVTFETPPNNE